MKKQLIKDIVLFTSIAALFALVFIRTGNTKKIGYVNIKEVFESFDLKKELQQKYQNQMNQHKRKVDSLGFAVQQMATMLEAETKPNAKQLDDFLRKKKAYMELVKNFEDEDKKINAEYDAQIISRMNEYIKRYGDENKYDLLIGNTGNGMVMQANEEMNCTKKVIEYINKTYAGK